MNIDQFISQLESSDAYRNNGEVKKLVSESRQTLIDLAHGNDGDAFKAELMKFNKRLDKCLLPNASGSEREKEKLAESLNFHKQYLDRLDTLAAFGFTGFNGAPKEGDAPVPEIQETFDSFTPEQLKLASTFQEPTLLLVPETSFGAKVAAINAHKTIDGQMDASVDKLYRESDSGSERIIGWRAMIVEGAQYMEFKKGDDVMATNEHRIESRKAARKLGERGMERHSYAMLMMESLRKNRPIDYYGSITMLDDDSSLSDLLLPTAEWNEPGNWALFRTTKPNYVDSKIRFRSSVGGDVLLNATESPESIEKLELEEQYQERILTLIFYGFLGMEGETEHGNAPFPSFEKVKATFTPEMLELAATFQEPTLLLVPQTSFAEKVLAIDTHKTMEGQKETFQATPYKKSDSGSETITGWIAVIVDGAKEMAIKEGDDVKLKFAQRIKKREAARKPGEKGMERHAYAVLMMESLRKGEPIDKDTYTLLDDDPALSASGVPLAFWGVGARQVDFGAYVPGDVSDRARLRSSVGGDVIL